MVKRSTMARPMLGALPVFLVLLTISTAARADVITGTFTGWQESTHMTVGDGTNHITAEWSQEIIGQFNWFYGGSAYSLDSVVADATGVTDIGQITNAASYSFQNGYIGPLPEGEFLVWKNSTTGYFGVIEITRTYNNGSFTGYADGTWWFQTNGSSNFAAPEPASLALCGSGLIGLAGLIRRKLRV